MWERDAIEQGTVAKLSRSVNVVADRLGRVVSLSAGRGQGRGSLAGPVTTVRQPPDEADSPSGPRAVPTDMTRRWRVSANVGGIPESAAQGGTWQDAVGTEGVLIIDDCTLFRENLAAVLGVNGIAVAGTAWDLPSLVAALEESNANLVLLNMATRDSQLLMRAAVDVRPGVPIIVVGTPEEDEQKIIACAEAGVAGYHMRGDSLDDLILLMHNVAGGRFVCPPRVSAILLRRLSNLASRPQPAARDLALTTREAQILKMLELGRSNRDIAERLDIAVHTVKNHVHNLFTKLGVNTRAEAAAVSRALWSEQGVLKN